MYNNAIKLNPNDSDAYYSKWVSLHMLWEYREAIKMYNDAIKLNPNYSNAYYNKWN